MFEKLEQAAQDPLMAALEIVQRDSAPDKVDLSIGIYKDAGGRSAVLQSVKASENWLVETQESKSYLSSLGNTDFLRCAAELTFGDSADSSRVAGAQTVGGSGALRIGAELIRCAKADARVWISDPSWANHVPIMSNAGLMVEAYPYYDRAGHTFDFDGMMQAMSRTRSKDIVILHGCCHNPSGADLTFSQWQRVADALARTGAVPFVDMAYQGFANGLAEDAAGLRHLVERLPEVLVSVSFSKNFSLYRDRVGALFLVSRLDGVDNVGRHMARIIRTNYSMPPDHGAAVIARILSTPTLRQAWIDELDTMRARIALMRRALVDALGGNPYAYIAAQKGMFSFLDLTPDQVRRLREDHHIYVVGTGRINIAGLTLDNVARVASAIREVTSTDTSLPV